MTELSRPNRSRRVSRFLVIVAIVVCSCPLAVLAACTVPRAAGSLSVIWARHTLARDYPDFEVAEMRYSPQEGMFGYEGPGFGYTIRHEEIPGFRIFGHMSTAQRSWRYSGWDPVNLYDSGFVSPVQLIAHPLGHEAVLGLASAIASDFPGLGMHPSERCDFLPAWDRVRDLREPRPNEVGYVIRLMGPPVDPDAPHELDPDRRSGDVVYYLNTIDGTWRLVDDRVRTRSEWERWWDGASAWRDAWERYWNEVGMAREQYNEIVDRAREGEDLMVLVRDTMSLREELESLEVPEGCGSAHALYLESLGSLAESFEYHLYGYSDAARERGELAAEQWSEADDIAGSVERR